MKTFIKQMFARAAMAVLALVGTAAPTLADVHLSIDDFTANQGEAKTVEILMTNDETNITEVQFDLVIPENMTFNTSSAKAVASRMSRGQVLQPVTKQEDGSYRFFINSAATGTVKGTSGAIITFQVTANSDLGFNPTIAFKNVSVNDVNANHLTATSKDGRITFAAAEANVTFSADETEISILPGETKQIGITMQNGRNIATLEGKIALPEGLEFSKDDEGEVLSYTDRIPASAVFELNKETGIFVLTSATNEAISGTDGTLFYINVKATDALAKSSTVVVQSLVVGTPSALGFDLTDVLQIRVVDATEYDVTATVTPDGAGTVIGTGKISRGATCTLTATAAEGYDFVSWTIGGTEVSTDATYPFVPTADVAAVANFKAHKYTVKFILNGETVLEQGLDFGATITVPTAPDKTGYTFSGWGNVAATMPAQDVTYTGTYSVNQYSVRFVIDDTTISNTTMDYGAAITAPTAPAKEGYTFAGWTPEVAATVPVGGATYTGSYTVNQHVVKFVADGVTVSETTQDFGSAITAPTAPAKEGYTFANWTPEVAATVPDQDVTYTAQYTVNQYTAKFVADGETLAENSIDFGTAITTPAAPTKEGYTFTGWSPEVPSTMPAQDVTYTAQWAINQYVVKFVIDGTTLSEQTLDYGTAITAPTAPERIGYTFAGWTPTVAATVPAQDVTYTGRYTTDKFIVRFVAEGTTLMEEELDYGTAITAPTAPAKTGYTFTGWSPEVAATMPAQDVTYTAQYSVNKYTVKFVIDGTTVKEQQLDYGAAISAPTATTRTGYTFSGWSPTVATTMPAQDVTYTGSYTVNQYTVKFVIDGETISEQTLDYGTAITTPTAPAKTGYTFNGWSPTVASTVPAQNVTYTGSYTVNQYVVKFVIDGETVSEQTLDFGAAITAPTAPTRQGYLFSGWIPEVATEVPAQDVTYTGSYILNEYTITFVIEGEVIQEKTLTLGAAITTPTAPEKEGYTFDGWADVPATMPTQDLTINGSYTVNKYVVQFIIDDECVFVQNMEFGTAITAPEVEEKEGYAFSGWTPDVAATVPAHNVTYKGSYVLQDYSLTWILDGEVYKREMVYYGAVIKAPSVAFREGFEFSGWLFLPKYMPAREWVIRGRYIANNYWVTFIANGDTISRQYIDCGSMIEPPAAPKKEGYIFDHWDGLVDVVPAHDVTFTAIYRSITDGIATIDDKNQKEMVVYTIDGKELRKIKATQINSLGKGIYIINGKKVMVN